MIQQDLTGLSVYSAAQCRELDRIAMQDFGIPGYTLMRRAGQAAYKMLSHQWPNLRRLVVFAGSGNNAGDGFVIASLAKVSGMAVTVYLLSEPEKLHGDAALAYQEAKTKGVRFLNFSDQIDLQDSIVVDAMLGTGLGGNVRGAYSEAIELINTSTAPVLAVDIPSGLCSDTGRPLGYAVKANKTLTFIGLKQGLLTAKAANYVGKLGLDSLEIPDYVYEAVKPKAVVCSRQDIAVHLPKRHADAHKGDFGHVLVVGGDYGMAGAVAMAAEACLRVGAGLVSVATRVEHVAALISRRPELMAHGVQSGQELAPLLSQASVVVLGPGLGQSAWSEQLFQQLEHCDAPVVLDADGLNLLAQNRVLEHKPRNWVYTPHPGEAARLLEQSKEQIQTDRFASVSALQAKFGGVAILKGVGSLIASSEQSWISPFGNPGMASGGMGDVLSGVIAGLLAQGLNLEQAAHIGVTIHGLAGDIASQGSGERGLLATDLMPALRRLVNEAQL